MHKEDFELEGFDVPPRYASSAKLHLGHAISYSFGEICKEISGGKVYPECYDGNGLPIERMVEKEKGIKPNSPNFYQLCSEKVEENIKGMRAEFRALNLTFNSDQYYQTDSDEFRFETQKNFINLYSKGAIYRDKQEMNWCFSCGTAISESEIDLIKREEGTWILKKEGEVVAKIRERGLNQEINPILISSRFKFKKGRFRIGGKEKEVRFIHLKKGDHIPDGVEFSPQNMSHLSFLKKRGMKRIQDLESFGEGEIILDVEISNERVSYRGCWRCKNEVGVKEEEQWFLKTSSEEIKKDLIDMNERIDWYPLKMSTILKKWIEGTSWDWVISRKRVYGTQIPFWQCSHCGYSEVPENIEKYLGRGELPSKMEKCCENPSPKLTEEIFDTWFDSSLTPFFLQKKWGIGPENFCRLQSSDIIRTWAYFSLIKGYYEGKLPWKKILIAPFMMVSPSEEMHASSGNAIWLEELLKKYSTFEIKYYAAHLNPGKTAVFEENILQNGRRLKQKIANIFKFLRGVENQEDQEGDELKTIRKLAEKLASAEKENLQSFIFSQYIRKISEMIFNFSKKVIPEIKKGVTGGRAGKDLFKVLIRLISKLIGEAKEIARVV